MNSTLRNGSLFLGLIRLALALVLGALACNPAVKDGLGPIIPIPNVVGSVLRDGAPAADLSVEIRNEAGETLFDTRTDAAGEYGLAEIPAGVYEIKVSGKVDTDFDSVSRPLAVGESSAPLRIADLDIHAHGASTLAPAAGEELPRPSPGQPVQFSWTMPSLAVNSARVNLYDAGGLGVWSSAKEPVEETSWNGIGSEGEYRGLLATGDLFSWRVKLELADGSEARLPSRALLFTGPQHEATTATGSANRDGDDAAALSVSLRGPDGVVILETETDERGEYVFGFVEPGMWEVKVSGSLQGDFDSVSYEFEVADIAEAVELPDLDVHAHGAETLLPADGSTQVTPGFFTPLVFTWTLPDTDVAWARVKLYDAAGEIVWSSVKEVSEQATWNGIANEGDQAGQPVQAGDYTWRIKLELDETIVARLATREIHFVD